METTNGSETFSMSELNQWSWNQFLTFQTFLGTAAYRPNVTNNPENITENDAVRSIADSLYNDSAGIEGLSKLMDNLAVSMTSTYVLSLKPTKVPRFRLLMSCQTTYHHRNPQGGARHRDIIRGALPVPTGMDGSPYRFSDPVPDLSSS